MAADLADLLSSKLEIGPGSSTQAYVTGPDETWRWSGFYYFRCKPPFYKIINILLKLLFYILQEQHVFISNLSSEHFAQLCPLCPLGFSNFLGVGLGLHFAGRGSLFPALRF